MLTGVFLIFVAALGSRIARLCRTRSPGSELPHAKVAAPSPPSRRRQASTRMIRVEHGAHPVA